MKPRFHNYKVKPARMLFILSLTLLSMNVKAQYEPMFTQYKFNETFINPAYAGSHENISATLLYRDQWVGINGSPKTQTLSLHSPLERKRIGVGLSVMNESIGVSKQLSVNAQFSYRIRFPNSALSFGVSGGFVNDEENLTDVKTIIQGDHQFSQDIRRQFLPNAGFGIYYYSKRFYAGFSIPRMLENKLNLREADVSVTNVGKIKIWHYYLTSGYVFDLNDELKCRPSVLVKVVQNAPIELDGNLDFLIHEFLWLGAGYRTGDAISAMIGFQVTKQLLVGYSYDYTLTTLQKYNSGSHEIALRFNFDLHKNSVISTRYF